MKPGRWMTPIGFFRRVEHRLQIEAEQQTHTVPEDTGALRRLARSLGFPSAEQFHDELARTDAEVCARFSGQMSLTSAEGTRGAAEHADFSR